jgi:phytoene dehydrogenase-like protein
MEGDVKREYDVIIIGCGPNGLQIGAYLAKAGQRVLLLEKRLEDGGGLATEQVTLPDYFHNTHAVFHMMVDYAPVFQDFPLETEYNISYLLPELQWVMPLPDGRSICVYNDVERTCASLAKISRKDAETYRDIYYEYHEMMNLILGPQTFVKPEPAPLAAARMEALDLGRKLSALAEMTPLKFVNNHFESDPIKTLMLYACCHWGLSYKQAGVGYMIPLYLNRMTNYRLAVGGSHRVSSALLKIIYEHQGEVRFSAQIDKIIVENGVAKGVVLQGGYRYLAHQAVVSTIDIDQTFLKYVGVENLEPDFVEMIKAWQWEKWSLCTLHLALEEAPRFKGSESDSEINKACVYLLGYENSEELIKQWDLIEQGALPEKAGYIGTFPSMHDPYQAPKGRCTGLLSQMAPFKLKGEDPERWLRSKFRNEMADYQLRTLEKYAPNLTRDKILWWNITTPMDIENKFANMVKGSYKQGQYHPLQMGYLRPNQDCSHNKTPVKNLFLGGANVYPGGCVIWGPGYICANTVAEKCGIEKWWKEPEYIIQSREKGYIP